MRVLCLATHPTLGAGNRLRIEQYAPLMRDRGIELEVSPFFDDATYRVLYEPGHTLAKAAGVVRGVARRIRDVVRARRYDLVIVYRESAPLGPPIAERLIRAQRVTYLFDFDDAIFLRVAHPANRRWAWLRDPSRAEWTARHACAVIAGNEYLAEWARGLNRRVTTIPTPVDTERHRPAASPRRGDGPIVIGWVGSSTTAPYLRFVDRVLERVASRHDVVVRVIGGSYSHDRVSVEVLPYRLEAEPSDIAAFDIGILPEPDDDWVRGKGAFKALLYMAAALPVVASRVGVNAEVIGEGGFCVGSEDEWVEALERLIADSGLRATLGAKGRARVEERYSLRVQAPRFAAALREGLAAADR